MKEKPTTIPGIVKMKAGGEKISMLTAYDYLFAQLMDRAGIDIILVGDTLGMVFQGHETTLPVTLEDTIYHTRAVKRGVRRALVIADMPFLTYQVSLDEAVRNAGRLLKEGGADGIKLEGGTTAARIVKRLTDIGIPVMGHVGLGPQSCKLLGGYKIQGKTAETAQKLIDDAKALESAGAFSIVVEAVPWPVTQRITEQVAIPTIGIGAGPYCDGQVLVHADMLGLFTSFKPHFVRRFAPLGEQAQQAFIAYHQAVKDGSFPTLDESYSLDEEVGARHLVNK